MTKKSDKVADEQAAQTNKDQTVENKTDSKSEKCEEASAKSDAEEKPEVEETKEVEKSKEEVLEEKYNELNDNHLRLMADFDNYRKRTMREKMELIKNASARVVTDLLPIIDNFERALNTMETAEDVASVSEGVKLIYNQMGTLLTQNGVKVIETESKPFDTEYHEAITTIPAPTPELKDKIVDCTTKGYMMNDKVIRHAKVVVGQ